MLQELPEQRPSINEISNSPLLPARIEQTVLQKTMREILTPHSVHRYKAIQRLMQDEMKPISDILYDYDLQTAQLEPACKPMMRIGLRERVIESITEISKRHGAVRIEPALLIPKVSPPAHEPNAVSMLDLQGDVVSLPWHPTVPFARHVARMHVMGTMKRFGIGQVFHPPPTGGQPLAEDVGSFDIVRSDSPLSAGLGEAEVLKWTAEVPPPPCSPTQGTYTSPKLRAVRN